MFVANAQSGADCANAIPFTTPFNTHDSVVMGEWKYYSFVAQTGKVSIDFEIVNSQYMNPFKVVLLKGSCTNLIMMSNSKTYSFQDTTITLLDSSLVVGNTYYVYIGRGWWAGGDTTTSYNLKVNAVETDGGIMNIIPDTVITKSIIPCGTSAEYFKSLGNGGKVSKTATAPNLFPAYAIEHCGKFDVYYEDLIITNPQVGFSAPAGLGTTRRNTLCQVLTYIQSVFDFSNVPAAAPIKLHINQSFAPVVNPAPVTTTYFAKAGPFFNNTGIPHIINGFVNDYVVNGTDYTTSSTYHAELITNFDKAYDSNGNVIPITWHDNPALTIGNCNYDLFSVLLHEIGHTLGWMSYIHKNNITNFPESINGFNQYSGIDYLLQKGTLVPALSLNPLLVGPTTNPSINPMFSGITTAITNNDIWISPFAAPDNHPVYSGILCTPWSSSFSLNSVLSHMDDQMWLYTFRSRISPGDIQDYVMGPFGIKGVLRRSFTDVEINTLRNIGYTVNAGYIGAINLANLPPYSTKMAGYTGVMNTAFPELVPADFPSLVNDVGSSLVFDLATDPTLIDPEGDIITIAPGSLVNIRGCGNGGNNHSQLTVGAGGQTITFTPRPNFYGRAQFGFKLFDGREVGSYVIYTIDVLKGTNVTCTAGSNIILNGDLEEGTEVKQLGIEETIDASSREEDVQREGKLRQGIQFADSQPYCYISNGWGPFGSGEIVKDSWINCNGTTYKSSAGSWNTSFPIPWGIIYPNSSGGIGERYKKVFNNYNYFNLCSDMQNCKRYILEFDYYSQAFYATSGTNVPLTVGFTNSATFPGVAAFTYSIIHNITIVNGSWQHIVIPFTYCGTTPASILNLRQLTTPGLYMDNLQLNEDLSPAPPLIVSITPANPSICIGDNITLNSTVTNVLCNATYSWMPGGQSTSSIIDNPTVTTNYVLTVDDGCRNSVTNTTVTVNPIDNASFSYTSATYCQTGTNPTPTISGLAGGTFTSSPTGLVFSNVTTGLINLAASASGTYNITYTTNGNCPNNSMTALTIVSPQIASFSYPQTSYCNNAINPIPTFSSGGIAGIFSSTTGLVFVNTSTGEINLSASTPGTYIITNTIAASAPCAAVIASTNITINTSNITASASPTTVVSGGPVILTTNATGAVWTPGGSGSTITVYPTTTTTYIVNGNDPITGCSGTTTVTVSVVQGCTAPIMVPPIPNDPATFSTYYGTSFSGSTIAINGDFTVNNNFSISLQTILCAPNVKIIILPGKTLTITTGRLFSCGTQMWNGIEIKPGGKLIMQTDSWIEDAKIAVLSDNTGAIANFQIYNTTFNRNYIGIKVVNYSIGSTPHPGKIRACLFDSQSSTTNTTNTPLLDAPYNTQTAEWGIQLSNVNNIIIGDASSPAYQNKFKYLRIGIRAQGSFYTVYNNDFQNNFPASICVIPYPTPSGFTCPIKGWAIWNTGTKSIIGGYAANQSNNFKNLSNGIMHEEGYYLDVLKNTFTNITSSSLLVNSIAILTTKFSKGNIINIRDNDFTGLETGIKHLNNNLTTYLAQGNLFKNFSSVGVLCLQNVNDKISIISNNFNQNATSAYTGNTGINISNVVLPLSSSPLVTITNNSINKVYKGITLVDVFKPQVVTNTIAFVSNITPLISNFYFGIRTQNSDGEYIFQNSVTKGGAKPTAAYENSVYGISIETNATQATITGNSTTQLGTGLRFRSYFNGQSNVSCNIMTNNWSGLTVDAVNIGQQGMPASMTYPNGFANDNMWSNPTLMVGSVSVRGAGSYIQSPFYTRSANFPWCPPLNKVVPANSIYTTNSIPSLSGGLISSAPQNPTCTNICYSPPCMKSHLVKIASNQNPFDNISGNAQFLMQQGLLKGLLADSTLIDSATSDGIALKLFMDTTLSNTEMGKIALASNYYAQGDIAAAKAINSNVHPKVSCAEEYHKIVNSIFFETWAIDQFYFSPEDSLTLTNIAMQDPLVCGSAIYDARVMMGIDMNDFSPPGKMMESNTIEDNAVSDKVGVLYPNPALDKCTYEAELSETQSGFIMMYDLNGKLLSSYKLNTGYNKLDIDLSSYSNGIYLYKIFINGDLSDYKKLVITK